MPFLVLAHPEDDTDTTLDPGESWVLTKAPLQNYNQRPDGGQSLNDLVKQAINNSNAVFFYVYGLLAPENSNVSLRNVEIIAEVRGGLDLF